MAILLAWIYFRHITITRPPIGVFSLGDVAALLVGVVVVPYLYLGLPVWLVAVLLGVGVAGMLDLVAEPVLPPRLRRLIVGAIVACGAASVIFGDTHGLAPHIANNLVLVVVATGAANLWAQSGLRARDAAVLAGGLAVYDLVFTSLLPTTSNLFDQLSGRPFAPMLVWPDGSTGGWTGLGLGDLVVVAVWPLLMRKAFGLKPTLVAVSAELVTIAILISLPAGPAVFPVMVVLGPVIVAQYAWCRRRIGVERTAREYLLADTPVARVSPVSSALFVSLSPSGSSPPY
jgi:hypothetical protein